MAHKFIHANNNKSVYLQIYCERCGSVVYDNSLAPVRNEALQKNRHLACLADTTVSGLASISSETTTEPVESAHPTPVNHNEKEA